MDTVEDPTPAALDTTAAGAELEALHAAGVLSDQDLADAQARLAAMQETPAAAPTEPQAAPDASSPATEPLSPPASPETPSDAAGDAPALSPADQDRLASVATSTSDTSSATSSSTSNSASGSGAWAIVGSGPNPGDPITLVWTAAA